ncbi:MAG: PPOX class F420-dependent oxidoreductase [Candidatus Dormibacteria bacterium]|jgi:PPOX class probable F420-dependent enzyme|nr:PPOX class F420-dependent oxidoreductase [Chloroflexota bacterium]
MPSPSHPRLTEDQVALLREKVLAHVATIMPDGSPQVTPVWVDTDGEAVLFNTAKGRLKHRNLSRDPRVAISITDRNDDYRTVVIRGRAELIDESADELIDRLAKKYRGLDRYPFRQPGEERVTVRVLPETIHRRG